jgi:methyltransferase (TIGR00027 family)
MRAGHASRTAEHNALFRALEACLPAQRRLFEDPLAGRFLTWPLSLVPLLARVPGIGALVPRFIDRRWPGVRTALVARTRLIDEGIAEAMREPIEQVVVLGAGYDSRAYRLAELRGRVVFEVDHPDTQAAKQRALLRALGDLPRHVRFVATDFTQRDLQARMAAAGHAEGKRSLILWEGVTNYLTGEAVDATLRWCARSAAESLLLFTYVHSDLFARPEAFAGSQRLFASLEKVGERFTFGIHPGELPEFLARRGLLLLRDTGAAEYRERYFGEAAHRMRGHEFYRVALARVVRH